MTFKTPFIRLTAEGGFGVSASALVEQFRCNFNFPATSLGVDYGPPRLLAFATAAAPIIGVYHAATAPKVGSNCWLTGCAAAVIDTNGRYAGGGSQPTSRFNLATAAVGNGTPTGPWSQALCLTFRTGILRGPAHAGRIYYPATALAPVVTTGALSSTVQDQIVTAAVAMLNGLNGAANSTFGPGHTLSVMSQVGAGTTAPVVRVEVGARLDSQERRERNTSEAYRGASIAQGLFSIEERDRRLQDEIEDAIRRAGAGSTP